MFKITCPNCNTQDKVSYVDDKSTYITDSFGEFYVVYKCECGCYFKAITSFEVKNLKHEIVYSEVYDV